MRTSLLAACLLAMATACTFAKTQPSSCNDDLGAELRHHLEVVQRRVGTSRKVAGGATLGVGALWLLGAFIASKYPPNGHNATVEILVFGGITYGAALVAVSLPVLLVPSRAERVWRQYAALLAATEEEKTE